MGAPFSAPTLSSIEATGAGIRLAWTAVSGANGYVVKYGTSTGNYTVELNVGNVLTYTVSGLTDGVTYYFAVEARDNKLLLEMDGTDGSTSFIDSSPYAHTVTPAGNVQLDTAQKYQGSASGLFDGGGDSLSIPDSSVFLVEEPDAITIEGRFRFSALPTGFGEPDYLFRYGDDAAGSWHLVVDMTFAENEHRILFGAQRSSGHGGSLSADVGLLNLNQWYHIKFVKYASGLSTRCHLYLDGVLIANDTITFDGDGSFWIDIDDPIQIGYTEDDFYFNGWIDNFFMYRQGANSNELSAQGDSLPVDGTDYCPYVSDGKVRKLVSTVTGLDHLEGMSVSVVADGIYVGEKTVSAGTITLDDPAGVIHVGLKYRGVLIPLNLIVAGQLQNSISFGKNVSSIALVVANTVGVKYGTSLYNLQDIPDRDSGQEATDPQVPFTGTIPLPNDDKWEEDKNIIYVQDEPYPCKLNAMNVTIEVGEK